MLKMHKVDESRAYLEYDDFEEVANLSGALSYYVPGYRFMPLFKNGTWDGKIYLLDLGTKTFPIGLAKHVYDSAKEMGIQCQIDPEVARCFYDKTFSDQDFEEFLDSTRFFSKKQEIFPRDDQIEATKRALKMKRCINLCPTSFGKSLSITIECLYLVKRGMTCLIVVPTKGLVDQFANDIRDYATNEEGGTEPWLPVIQTIYGGKDKELAEDTQICISTWQSLQNIVKSDRKFMNRFGCICLDECHRGAAQVIQKLMMSAKDVAYRTGWTGTLANDSVNEMLIKGLFGEPRQIITTTQLMDRNIVARLRITIAKFRYPPEWGKRFKFLDYVHQCKWFDELPERTDAVAKMALAKQNAGLVLYRKIAHGESIFERIRELAPERTVYLVHSGHFQRNGEKYKSFEELKPMLEKEKDSILVANYQLVGTGVSVKNIHYVMFAAPIKSYITTIQSIGRGLRVSDTKKSVELIDIVDDMSYKARVNIIQNYALRHFEERFRIYNENGFDYSMEIIPVEPKPEALTF